MIKKILAMLVLGLFLTNCSLESETKEQKAAENSQTLQRSAEDMERFRNDTNVGRLHEVIRSYRDLKPSSDSAQIVQNSIEIQNLVNEIFATYGEEDAQYYATELAKTHTGYIITLEGDGNKCKRNSDGTVNNDACNFFEMISVVLFTSLQCHLVELPTLSQINSHYNCIQSIICDKC